MDSIRPAHRMEAANQRGGERKGFDDESKTLDGVDDLRGSIGELDHPYSEAEYRKVSN